MLSSGTTGIVTSGATAVALLTMPSSSAMYNHMVIVNTGMAAGFFSIDNGVNWAYIPGATTAVMGAVESWEKFGAYNVLMKRASGDMSGVFAFAQWLDD